MYNVNLDDDFGESQYDEYEYEKEMEKVKKDSEWVAKHYRKQQVALQEVENGMEVENGEPIRIDG